MQKQPPVRHLDPKVKLVWFLPQAAFLFVIWLIVLVALFLLGIDSPIQGLSRFQFAVLLFLFMLVFIAAPIYAYLHIEYMSFTYELGEKEFIIRQGVFTRNTIVIPYARIQNINTQRTVLERMLGLASLLIDTAGTNPQAAEGLLPGVSNKDALVREIMDKVEKARAEDGLNSSYKAGSSNASLPSSLPSERQLLYDILKELVEIKQQLKQTHSNPSSAEPKFGERSSWPRNAPGPLHGKE